MPYQLLTGATGLLGRYLLWDSLLNGRRVALVVRRSATESPRQRVESILAAWERELGYALPRPPVFAGDICEAGLGLSDRDAQWIRERCSSVVHSAASLSFQADARTGEPERSNVGGTRNVLDLCREFGIRQFHHVSTAFVCGLRSGRVTEDELDLGQRWGNDYERSKVQAEKLVRAAEFLDRPTIFRPATIVGDSRTGFANTFHGFYAPIQIGQALIDRFKPPRIDDDIAHTMQMALGLAGNEHKNFVPVDWVASVINFVIAHPEHHGRTYHLSLTQPVRVDVASKAMRLALDEYAQAKAGDGARPLELGQLQSVFRDQMDVYRSHWRNDPQFDSTNTIQAAPHLPAPEVTQEMLLRTAKYALKTNFGWPRPQPIRPEFDVEAHLQGLAPLGPLPGGESTILVGLQVNGPGGGEWTIAMDNGRLLAAEPGLVEGGQATLYLNSQTFQQCVLGQLSAAQAAQSGRLNMDSSRLSGEQLAAALATVTAGVSTTS